MAVAVSEPVIDIPELNPVPRFIVDGIVTVPIALYGFLVFPGLPRTTKAFYLSQEVWICNAIEGLVILIFESGTCLGI